MLIGEYSVALGEKNRIALPKKLREELSNEVIVTRGYDGCALLLDKNLWQSLIESIGSGSLFRMNARDTRRYLFGGASETDLDKQGRFVIPDYIVDHAELVDDVIFLGVGEWIEVWSNANWLRKSKELTNNASDIAEKLINNDSK